MIDRPDDLVACDSCGVVFDKDGAADSRTCPVCDYTVDEITAVPAVGYVNKWWTEVES